MLSALVIRDLAATIERSPGKLRYGGICNSGGAEEVGTLMSGSHCLRQIMFLHSKHYPSSAFAITPVYAAAIEVDGTDCTLENAINAAETDQTAGGCPAGAGSDTITLSTNVTIDQLPPITTEVTIEGDGHSISGDDQLSGFHVSVGTLTLNDLTITNVQTTTQGGALYVYNGDLTIKNVKVKDSVAGDVGGGLYALDSDVVIANSEFSNNSTETSHGGAIYFASSGEANTLSIQESVFKNNEAVEDGGAVKIARGVVNIVKSSFVENNADEGGAIESSNATLTIENSTFSANTAREGGGISSFASDTPLTHVTLAYNSAEEQGGGLAVIGWSGDCEAPQHAHY